MNRQRSRLTGFLVVAVSVAGGLTAVGAGGPASAATGPALSALVAQRQPNLITLVAEVDRAAPADPGFSSSAIDVPTNTVIVYRAGEAPGARATLTAYSGLRPAGGAAVTYRPALLTATQTTAVMDAVTKAAPELEASGVRVTGITPEPGGPVTIGVATLSPAALALADRFDGFGAGTVKVVQDNTQIDMWNGRQDDFAPYYSGGRILLPAGHGACTVGWAGKSGSGVEYMMTARHCVVPSDQRFWDGGGDYLGKVSHTSANRDIVLMMVNSSSRMWDGPYNSTTANKQVTGATPPKVGISVCTSGAASGAICSALIKATVRKPLLDPEGGTFWADIWYADHNAGKAIGGPGDSGGPVFIPSTNGTTVAAVGIITGGEGNVPCQGIQGRVCGTRLWFGDAYSQARDWSLDLAGA